MPIGDIQTNPGTTLQKISKEFGEIANDIRKIKERSLTDKDKKLDSLANLEVKVTSCQNLEARLEDLENRSGRLNIIVYGLPESEKGKENESLESTVKNEIIKGIPEIDTLAIKRIHRLGRPSPGKVMPVIPKLLDPRDKTNILKQGSKI